MLSALIVTTPVPVSPAAINVLGSITIEPLFTSVPETVTVAPLSSVSVAPALIVFAPLNTHDASASIVVCTKSTNSVPSPDKVPADAAEASSSVLLALVPPIARPESP